MGFRILVATGGTSSLFSSFLNSCRYLDVEFFTVFVRGNVCPPSDKVVVHRSYNNEAEFKNLLNDCIRFGGYTHAFWFSPHVDVKNLEILASCIPTLVIGSGIVIDFYQGHVTEPNPYLMDKLKMSLIQGKITTFHPGFFIDDDNEQDVTTPYKGPKKGLHAETSKWLFAVDYVSNKNWVADKYVTPKTFICKMIELWLFSSEKHFGMWYHCGSQKSISRAQLRGRAGLSIDDEFTYTPKVYTTEWLKTREAFGISLADSDLDDALKKVVKS
jgi:hypothetical protein